MDVVLSLPDAGLKTGFEPTDLRGNPAPCSVDDCTWVPEENTPREGCTGTCLEGRLAWLAAGEETGMAVFCAGESEVV